MLLLRELELLKQLNHPNIRRVFEVFVEGTMVYIAMELCTGGELFDVIQERTILEEADIVKIMDQLLRALSYFHGKNVIHRDLKPENILLERSTNVGQIKIINF